MARIGIIGRGWGARVQAPSFRDVGLEVVSIVGSKDDWRALVASPDVDLITITTPPSEHREMALAALAAGKHVICEKPTALNANEAEEMLAASRAHPEQLALIDHELRFLPSFRAARERIGELGGVRYVEVRYASPSRGDRTRAWNWWSDAARGGGALGAVGSHFIDATRYLAGEIERVEAATLATIIDERPFEGGTRKVTADDFAALTLRLHGGALATLTISAVAGGDDEPTTITIHGERGAFRLGGEELLFAKRGEPFARIAGNDMADRAGNSPGGAFGSGTLLLAQALKAALDDGDRDALKFAATFEDGLAQQRVLDEAREAAAK